MKDILQTYLQIESYLEGKMSPEERSEFESLMEQDSELSALVKDYDYSTQLVIRAEQLSIIRKLDAIHQSQIRKKNILWVIGIFLLIVTAYIGYDYFSKESSQTQVKQELDQELARTKNFLLSDPTPLSEIDSMMEADISQVIKQSKKPVLMEKPTLPIAEKATIKLEELKSLNDFNPNTINASSRKKLMDTIPFIPINPLTEDSVTSPCFVNLSLSSLSITNSCTEKPTGSIQFLLPSQEYEFSILTHNFQSNPNFNNLGEGDYAVSIRKISSQCISQPLKVSIAGYQCNYVIQPSQFIYVTKSLQNFSPDNTVEIFIFNKSGQLVYNTKTLTSENFHWEGQSGSGDPLPMGNYTYLIKGSRKLSKGEITIIR